MDITIEVFALTSVFHAVNCTGQLPSLFDSTRDTKAAEGHSHVHVVE